jgi:hypothetical protein
MVEIFSPDFGVRRPLVSDLARAYGADPAYIRRHQLNAPYGYHQRAARLEQRSNSIPEVLTFYR